MSDSLGGSWDSWLKKPAEVCVLKPPGCSIFFWKPFCWQEKVEIDSEKNSKRVSPATDALKWWIEVFRWYLATSSKTFSRNLGERYGSGACRELMTDLEWKRWFRFLILWTSFDISFSWICTCWFIIYHCLGNSRYNFNNIVPPDPKYTIELRPIWL